MPLGKVVGRLKGTGGQLDIEWEIADFQSLPAEVNTGYDSPICFFCDTSWYIQMYPNGHKSNSSEGYLGIYVVRGDSGPPVTATYSLFLKKMDGRKEAGKENTFTFKKKDGGHGKPKVMKRSELIDQESEFMPTGVLKIMCSLKFLAKREVKANEMLRKIQEDRCKSTETSTQTEADNANEMLRKIQEDLCKNTEASTQTEADNDFESKETAAAVQDTKVLRDYKELLLSGENSDLTLLVKGQKFGAHRTILGARSPVFASMLSHNMKEKNDRLVDIVDCDPEYFPDFLRFLYCGSKDSITQQNACSLYRAAEKYDVQDLKSESLAFIKSHLDVDNFCDILTLALQHSEDELIKHVTDFFIENALEIVTTVKWQVYLEANTPCGNELIFKAFSVYKKPSP